MGRGDFAGKVGKQYGQLLQGAASFLFADADAADFGCAVEAYSQCRGGDGNG